MILKKLNTAEILKTFDGKDMVEQGVGEEASNLTLKKALLVYLVNANRIGSVTDNANDAILAYEAGVKIGMADSEVVLTDPQIDVLKKLVQCNKLSIQGRQEPMYGLVVSQQLLNILASAPVVDDKTSGGKTE